MTSKKDKEQTIQTYNRTAKVHAEKFNNLGPCTEDIERVFSFLEKENPKTIELGCGNGRDAKEIVKRTNDYLGIDLSSELIKLAKKNVPEADFELIDFEAFEFPEGVDAVFAFASLIHSDKESFQALLERASKALNSGGVFFMTVKYGEYQLAKIDKEGHGAKVYYFYTPQNISDLLPSSLKIVFEEIRQFKDQKWSVLILQKKV